MADPKPEWDVATKGAPPDGSEGEYEVTNSNFAGVEVPDAEPKKTTRAKKDDDK